MQNAGQQFGHGRATPHQGPTYGHSESSTTSGSITSSLRQFRKKDVDKQQVNDSGSTVAESHVARVAPHNHYPPRPQDCFRYSSQFPDYSLPTPVKYSEISDHQPLQEQIAPSVIQKAKGKEYMEMCNVTQPHLKQPYPDHLNNQQPYATDPNIHPHAQYIQKDPQVHPSYKPESQYYPKENQYQQLPHQMQKYNMPPQMRKYPTENDFLSKLSRIHPTMARSIMSDHHLRESQTSYQAMDQNRMYPHQNQRYMNYPAPMQNNPYPHGYMPPQPYPNYPSSCSYTRSPQMPPRFPSTNPHERSISPRRGYTENLPIPPINYAAIPQRISPNYGQYNPPDYAQHYQHRRGPVAPQDYYPQHCRTAQYMPHQMAQQEMTENRVTVSDSIKQYIENWADEETASEMNQIESNRLCKENLRIREEPSTETVYMINASELQYLENGIPLVTSENGIPLVTSENGQYFLKSGVTIDNSTGMVRIVEKTNQVEPNEGTMDRVVNLHIMDPLKPDCMLAGKPNELNQRQNENPCNINEKSRVIIHQNTVIQPGQTKVTKETETPQFQAKAGTSLPVLVENEIAADMNSLEKLAENVFNDCKKETVDKNCSPINMDQIEKMDDFSDSTSVICPLKLLEEEEIKEERSEDSNDTKIKNMPIIDLLPESLQNVSEEDKVKEEDTNSIEVYQEKDEKEEVCNNEEDKKQSEIIAEDNDLSFEKLSVENILCDDTDNEVDEFKDIVTNCTGDVNIKENETEIDQSDKATNEIIKEETKEEMAINHKDTKDLTNIKDISEDIMNKESMLKNEDLGYENKAPNTVELDIKNTVTTETVEDNKDVIKDCSIIVENHSVIFSGLSVTNETNNENLNEESNNLKVSAKTSKNLFTDTRCSEENVGKCTVKRTKRIFSVDDIINNIGNNTNKQKPVTQLSERRLSLQITREFLEREIDTSYLFLRRSSEDKEVCTDITGETEVDMKHVEQHVNKNEETIPEKEQEQQIEEQKEEIVEECKNDTIDKEKLTTEETSNVECNNDIIDDAKLSTEDGMITDEKIEALEVKEKEEIEEIVEKQTNNELQNLATEEEKFNDEKATHDVQKEEPSNEEQKTIPEIEMKQLEETKEPTKDSVVDSLINNEENVTIGPSVCEKEMEENQPTVTEDEEINTTNILVEQEITLDRTASWDNTNSADTLEVNIKENTTDTELNVKKNTTDADLNIRENTTDTISQSEIQYRNAIRVEENNVLLEIAGELVEISVNIINGKKVITVLPLSESTVVDFNDNYEPLDTTQLPESMKISSNEEELNLEVSQMFPVDEAPTEPEVIESTSEIIIGLDISLEEEIKLDLEKPPSFCTKAAKKCYENDLQIPSITTSEDITDNNNVNSYSPNDKVSSSKEQKPEKSKNEKKRTNKVVNHSNKTTSLKKKLNQSSSDRSGVKELMKIRRVKKETLKQSKEEVNREEEEEFIPFKDLIKARKLKKMKQQRMRMDDNVSADSTNRLDQEETTETDLESKLEECIGIREDLKEDSIPKGESSESLQDLTKDKIEDISEEDKSKDQFKQRSFNFQKFTKKEENLKYKNSHIKNNDEDPVEVNCVSKKKEDAIEKIMKTVTFSSIAYGKPGKISEKPATKSSKLEDPRLKSKSNGDILVPSVSELLKENEGVPTNKKKLSLAEYNNRKRKLTGDNEDKGAKMKKSNPTPESSPTESVTLETDMHKPKEQPCVRFKIQRPKSLDDINIFGKPKDTSLVKRKFSLEVTPSKPNYFDWEETQSPKTNTPCVENSHKRLNEFRGLINNNKSKIVVDVGDSKLASMENSEDEILQNYKEQVDSKLSSLNLQIPRVAKPPPSIINPFSNTETIVLMQRFLRNEKLTSEEMEKIKKIISYKRLMQQLDKINSPGLTSPLNPSYEIRKACPEKEMKLHLKKVPDEKKKKRFRNLYTESTSESDSDGKRGNGAYSVVQSNSYAAGVPKLIIKRKTEVPVPVVRLERLDLKILAGRKRKFC